MATMPISEFRRKCLHLLKNLPAGGLTITDHGQPVAAIAPPRRSPVELIGTGPGFRVDPNDDLFSTGLKWDAES